MTKPLDLGMVWSPEIKNFCVGWIVEITENGQALVDFPGNLMGPVKARSIMASPAKPDSYDQENPSVLLVFEKGNSTLPIIVGIIHDKLYPDPPSDEMVLSVDRPREGILDGQKMVLEAREEIVLRCGKSSVMLRKDGKVVVKGTQIVSRASAVNKIKGAAVKIN